MTLFQALTTRGTADDEDGLRSPLTDFVSALLGRRVRDFSVEVRDEWLFLRGRADNYHAKQLAQHAASTVTELPITNRIEVTYHGRQASGSKDVELGRADAGTPRVLLASGNDRLRSDCRDHLAAHGYVVTATGGVECVARLRDFTSDVAVLDADLLWGGVDGVLAYLRAKDDARVPVVLLAASARPMRLSNPPVVTVLEKPISMDALVRAVRTATGGSVGIRSGV
jgi:hypothetical protein